LSCIIHYIVSIRLRNPKTKILGGKSNIKAAYRQISLHGDTAEKCTIMFQGLGLTSLRLTFGGLPCLNEFCLASEHCTDLANDFCIAQEGPKYNILSSCCQFGRDYLFKARHTMCCHKRIRCYHSPDNWGRVDDFIDGGIVIVPDLNENSKSAIQALLLAIHILFRPVDKHEPILQEDCLSLGKLKENSSTKTVVQTNREVCIPLISCCT
jgi:hypothetical protein